MHTARRFPVIAAVLSLLLLGGSVAADDRPDVAKVGQLAPELSLSGWKNSKGLKMADLKGKVVVMKFWAVWCGPCKASLPKFKKLSEALKGKDVVFMGVHVKKDCAKMSDFVDSQKMEYPCGADDTGETAKKFGAKEIPYNVVIDKKGVVRALDATLDEAELQKLAAE